MQIYTFFGLNLGGGATTSRSGVFHLKDCFSVPLGGDATSSRSWTAVGRHEEKKKCFFIFQEPIQKSFDSIALGRVLGKGIQIVKEFLSFFLSSVLSFFRCFFLLLLFFVCSAAALLQFCSAFVPLYAVRALLGRGALGKSSTLLAQLMRATLRETSGIQCGDVAPPACSQLLNRENLANGTTRAALCTAGPAGLSCRSTPSGTVRFLEVRWGNLQPCWLS